MADIPLEHAMVCWNPGSNQVRVVRHPDTLRVSDGLRMTDGACEFERWADPAQRMKWLLQIFNAMVVRDGVDPQAAHQAFLAIPEYRNTIPEDQRGAE
jgi:hypothetical protein